MNSCLYKCTVMHHRLEPKRNQFSYKVFMFYIDLDELDKLSSKFFFISRNKFNLFSFHDKNHAKFPGQSGNEISAKNKILDYLKSNGVDTSEIKRVMLLTNFTTLGYLFNPVSFYYCYNLYNEPVCAVSEVSNTFGEMKLYLMNNGSFSGDSFHLYTPKLFYVSPFSELDIFFDFTLKLPAEKLIIRVDDYKNDQRFLLSALNGERKKLSDSALVYYFLSFPFITIKVIMLIYWQAFRLYLKKVPFISKKDNPQLQQDLIKL